MTLIEIVSIVAGVVVLCFTFADLFMTVFMLGGGAGPQSGFVAERSWRLALRLHSPDSTRSHSLMRAVGPAIILLVLAVWVAQMVLGWALVFVPSVFEDPGAVGFVDRVVFGGHSIIGRSGNHPALVVGPESWELVQSLAGLSGVVIVSVGLAYVLPILASVAHKRSIAATVNGLGDTVDDMYRLGCAGADTSFHLHLVALIPSVALCAERHRAYPVLHHFHSRDPHAALAPAIARLCLLLKSDRSELSKVNDTVVAPLTHAIHNLLDALGRLGLERYARSADAIDADALSDLHIDPATPAPDRMPSTEWLEAYVQFDGWAWEPIARRCTRPAAVDE